MSISKQDFSKAKRLWQSAVTGPDASLWDDDLDWDEDEFADDSGDSFDRKKLLALLLLLLGWGERRASEITDDLVSGRITEGPWSSAMSDLATSLAIAAGVLAYGGVGNVTGSKDATDSIESVISAQQKYLSGFIDEVKSGDSTLGPGTVNRAKLYGSATYSSYFNLARKREEDGGMEWERRIIDSGNPCEDCIAYASQGWQPIGTLPDIGDSECQVNCRCEFQYGTGPAPAVIQEYNGRLFHVHSYGEKVNMPYSGPSDAKLPENVKKLSKAKRTQWIAIFNKAKTAGKEDAAAFQLANGVVMGKKADEPDDAMEGVDPKAKVDPSEDDPNETEPDDDPDDKQEASDPGVDAVHVDGPLTTKNPKSHTAAYVQHLTGQLKKSGRFTDDEMATMMRAARAHAGGKGKTKAMAETIGNGSLSAKVNMVQSAINAEFNKPSPFSGYSGWTSTEAVFDDYAIIRADDGQLYRCDYSIDGDTIIFGDPVEVIETYVVATEVADICANGKSYRLFNECNFAEPPDWVPFLPKPGEYKHPQYGDVKITKKRNKNFIDNFKDGIYQKNLPINVEHQASLSGAVGWVKDLRMNEDEGVDAKVEWNERGKALIEDDRYKYFSPEWFDKWEDPATEKTHSDIAVGGAICVRPFFKEGSLKPLVASEKGLFFAESDAENESKEHFYFFTAATPISNPKGGTMPEVETPAAVQAPGMTEDQNKQFTELQSKVTEQDTLLKTLSEQKAAADNQVKEMSEKVAKIEKEAQVKRFNDEVKGRTEGGIQWVGKSDKHVTKLEQIADKFGEDSDFFKEYIEEQRTHSRQLEQSRMFGEVGSDAVEVNQSTATGKLKVMAEAIRKENPKLSAEQAQVEALTRNPDLYKQYNKELQMGVN